MLNAYNAEPYSKDTISLFLAFCEARVRETRAGCPMLYAPGNDVSRNGSRVTVNCGLTANAIAQPFDIVCGSIWSWQDTTEYDDAETASQQLESVYTTRSVPLPLDVLDLHRFRSTSWILNLAHLATAHAPWRVCCHGQAGGQSRTSRLPADTAVPHPSIVTLRHGRP